MMPAKLAKAQNCGLQCSISGNSILELAMNFAQMKDERLLLFYDAVRQQVFDGNSRYRLAGDGVRVYADKLQEEIERRRLSFRRIDWPSV
jgi:hypothetical protein